MVKRAFWPYVISLLGLYILGEIQKERCMQFEITFLCVDVIKEPKVPPSGFLLVHKTEAE